MKISATIAEYLRICNFMALVVCQNMTNHPTLLAIHILLSVASYSTSMSMLSFPYETYLFDYVAIHTYL